MLNTEQKPNWEELSQDLFRRLDRAQKIEVLNYIISSKHELSVNKGLK